MGEELSPGAAPTAGLVFVADPLDGTTNFLHGFPWYAVSIAAVVDGALTAAVVLNIANGEIFTATARRRRASRTAQPIRVSPITDPDARAHRHRIPLQARWACSTSTCTSAAPWCATPPASAAPARRRSIWATSRAAASRRSGSCSSRPGTSPPALLLVREAGGVVTDRRGGGADLHVGKSSILAGNPAMHAWLRETVAQAGTPMTSTHGIAIHHEARRMRPQFLRGAPPRGRERDRRGDRGRRRRR